MATLLDGFESISGSNPWTSSGYAWYDAASTTPTVTRTTSHVTEGTYSFRIQDTAIFGSAQLGAGSTAGGATIDLSAFTTLSLDYYGVTMGATTHATLVVTNFDLTDSIFVNSSDALSGAVTLNLDLTTAAFGLTDVLIIIGAESVASEGAFDLYCDNLRASAGGTSVPVFYNNLKTQGIA